MLHTAAQRIGWIAAASTWIGAAAQPVESVWPVEGPDDSVGVACAALSGWYAVADSFEDSVEIRDVDGALLHTITRADITSLLPWMNLTGGPNGPSGLAWSDSGRLLFILVHDDTLPGDGQGSDAVLRYDNASGQLNVFARLELYDSAADWPHLAAAHFEGHLFVATSAGGLVRYRANKTDATGVPLGTTTLPGGAAVRGVAVDRANRRLFLASDSTIYRGEFDFLPAISTVGSIPELRGLAYSDHYGGPGQDGLYALSYNVGSGAFTVTHVPADQASGAASFAPVTYVAGEGERHDLAASACGGLLIAGDEDAVMVRDASDARLSFNQWLIDEFGQVVAFCTSLISPDGEPSGWVIDGDVSPGLSRFHPATPDGAAWTVLALLMSDHLNADPEALPMVREILRRYAGQAGDGIAPSRTADGIIRHWIDPLTGGVKSGWDPEFATLSTMKIAAAAARAQSFYPSDQQVKDASCEIISRVQDWDDYVQSGTHKLYLKGLVGGTPDFGSALAPFFEGIIFVEQAAAYGGASSATSYSAWLNRAQWPTGTYLAGHPITGNANGTIPPAFVSLYSLLLQDDYRASAQWQSQIHNLRWSNAAWTDDNGSTYFTVFSAGTTKPAWGGYHADNLLDHPGDVTTFPSLMAFCADGSTAEGVAAYNAYRRGARETFDGGASILYRRSDVDPLYTPNSAGLPDVVLGGLGLAELIAPGSIEAVLTGDYPSCSCPADIDGDGDADGIDVGTFLFLYSGGDLLADLNGDSMVNGIDVGLFLQAYAAGC